MTDIIKAGHAITIAGQHFTTVDLSGHFFECIGIHTDDDVIFLGDSIFSREIIDK